MTDRAQFEAMLEALVNEDQEAAKEIFHNIVVAKSREIYEELLAEDFNLSEAEEEEEEESGEEEESSNPFGDSEEDGEEDEDEEGDATDDFSMDSEEDDMDGEGEGDLEDRVLDLEDALEELKAEFDSLMADEAGEEEHNDGVNDPDFGGEEDEFGGDEFGGDEFGGDEFGSDEFGDEEEEVAEAPKKIIHYHVEGNPEESLGEDEFMQFMEYVNKVALPKHGDNGVNTKSVVDNMKNDMGGTTANILRGDTESPTFANKGHLKGNGVFKGNPKEENFGNINVPGGKAGKTGFTHKEPGHGAEKKGKGDSAPNKKSIIGSRK